jgi:response regulator RpfG family c-di-GMP phosphodiesterase
MVRPTFLIAEPRPGEGISARKLVLETALYNVITAYSAPEALGLLHKFPNADAVVVHAALGEKGYKELIEAAVQADSQRLVVLLSPTGTVHQAGAHFHLSSHDPKQLLDLLLERFPVPESS